MKYQNYIRKRSTINSYRKYTKERIYTVSEDKCLKMYIETMENMNGYHKNISFLGKYLFVKLL